MTTSSVKDNIITKQFLLLRYASIVLYFWLRNALGRRFSAVEVLIKLVVLQALAFDHNCEEIEVESSKICQVTNKEEAWQEVLFFLS